MNRRIKEYITVIWVSVFITTLILSILTVFSIINLFAAWILWAVWLFLIFIYLFMVYSPDQ